MVSTPVAGPKAKVTLDAFFSLSFPFTSAGTFRDRVLDQAG